MKAPSNILQFMDALLEFSFKGIESGLLFGYFMGVIDSITDLPKT